MGEPIDFRTVDEAILAILHAASDAGRGRAVKEVGIIGRSLNAIAARDNMTSEDRMALKTRLMGYTVTHGMDGVLEAGADKIPAKLAPTIFCHVVDVILADRKVEEEEKKVLHRMSALLKLEPKQAQRIINIMVIKHQWPGA